MNIRGNDLPNSPIVNCKAIISEKGKLYLFIDPRKIPNLNNLNYKNIILCEENDLFKILFSLNKGIFCIDKSTCSIFEEKLINSNFKINYRIDPIYKLKSVKNKIEIKTQLKRTLKMV